MEFYYSTSTVPHIDQLMFELEEEANKIDTYKLGMELELPSGISNRIRVNHKHSPRRALKSVLQKWLHSSPGCPSWDSVVAALKAVDKEPLARRIEMKYCKGENVLNFHLLFSFHCSFFPFLEKLKSIFKKAMKQGYVSCRFIVCLLTGIAGSGTSHVKSLLSRDDPPEIRHSTPLAEAPIRLISKSQGDISSATSIEWRKVLPEESKVLVASAINAGVPFGQPTSPLPASEEVIPPSSTDSASEKVIPPSSTDSASEKVIPPSSSHTTDSASEKVIPPSSSHTTDSASGKVISPSLPASSGSAIEPPAFLPGKDKVLNITTTSEVDQAPAAVYEEQVDSAYSDARIEELMKLISTSSGSKQLLEVDWVYLIDSGGQPQFSEILPAFVHNASAVIYVLKLNEQLSDHPTIEYYDERGNQLSSYTSVLTNEQILLRSTQVLQSRKCISKVNRPNIFIVGTHKDLEDTCSETRVKKNAMLQTTLLCQGSFQENLVFHDFGSQELLYPVNAKKPSEEDERVAEELRRVITSNEIPEKIPLPWFVFEQFVQEATKKKGVISTMECLEIAKKLSMEIEGFYAALEYFSRLNLLVYYPRLLPDAVFGHSQVVPNMVSKLVQHRHELLSTEDVSAEWIQFRDCGVLTADILSKKFPEHFVEGLFSPDDLLRILNGLLTTFPLNKKEYIMPCLLPVLSPEEMDNHHQSDLASPATPLLIKYPDQVIPSGIFVLLVSFLKNSLDWNLLMDVSSGRPLCLYRNCVKFNLSTDVEGKITLMDSFNYLEVRLDAPPCVCQTVCFEICTSIIMGLEKAADTLGYQNLKPQTGFQVAGDEWISSVYGELTEQQKLWFHPTMESAEQQGMLRMEQILE